MDEDCLMSEYHILVKKPDENLKKPGIKAGKRCIFV